MDGTRHETTCCRCGRTLSAPNETGLQTRLREEHWVVIPNGDDTVVYCNECAKKIL